MLMRAFLWWWPFLRLTAHCKLQQQVLLPNVPAQVMCIIPWSSDDEVVALANGCPFGLGSNVFSGSQARARCGWRCAWC